jgi:hypothetical protein
MKKWLYSLALLNIVGCNNSLDPQVSSSTYSSHPQFKREGEQNLYDDVARWMADGKIDSFEKDEILLKSGYSIRYNCGPFGFFTRSIWHQGKWEILEDKFPIEGQDIVDFLNYYNK